MHLNAIVTTLVSSLIAVASATSSDSPNPPGLVFLYTEFITLGPIYNVGLGPFGNRTVYSIANGTISGPRINGTVLPVGGDLALTDGRDPLNGTIYPDVRQTIRTDDGAYIQIFETGASQPDGTVFMRDTFETGAPQYEFLNDVVGVSIFRFVSDTEIRIDAWQITAPDADCVE